MRFQSAIQGLSSMKSIPYMADTLPTGLVQTKKADETLDITFFIDSSATGMNDRTEGKLSMIQQGNKLLLLSENGEPYSVSIYRDRKSVV